MRATSSAVISPPLLCMAGEARESVVASSRVSSARYGNTRGATAAAATVVDALRVSR